jgi:50S ribosomal protein L16 3-hydroxylase
MVSFAATGGSVGAHVDQYDVFLLQAHGHRRWQVDASEAMGRKAPGIAFRDDVELKLLRDFHPTHEWVLAPATCSTSRPACRTTASPRIRA